MEELLIFGVSGGFAQNSKLDSFLKILRAQGFLAETINGLYKAELIRRRGPGKTREAVELATLEWVSWFNHHRLLEPIGYVPPAEAEANYYRKLASQAATPA
jgi:transposase InsO family protein